MKTSIDIIIKYLILECELVNNFIFLYILFTKLLPFILYKCKLYKCQIRIPYSHDKVLKYEVKIDYTQQAFIYEYFYMFVFQN